MQLVFSFKHVFRVEDFFPPRLHFQFWPDDWIFSDHWLICGQSRLSRLTRVDSPVCARWTGCHRRGFLKGTFFRPFQGLFWTPILTTKGSFVYIVLQHFFKLDNSVSTPVTIPDHCDFSALLHRFFTVSSLLQNFSAISSKFTTVGSQRTSLEETYFAMSK